MHAFGVEHSPAHNSITTSPDLLDVPTRSFIHDTCFCLGPDIARSQALDVLSLRYSTSLLGTSGTLLITFAYPGC